MNEIWQASAEGIAVKTFDVQFEKNRDSGRFGSNTCH